jgi:hypothetical protein
VHESGQKLAVLPKCNKSMERQKVNLKHMEVGDLVLLRSPCTDASGKLEPKWTEPFVFVERKRSESFRLADNEGRVHEHSWNPDDLHCFFI